MTLWRAQFEPKTAHELVVNKSKINEIKKFLENSFIETRSNYKKNNILIISGPSGSGKTSLLRCLCNSLSIHILEWESTNNNEGLGSSFYRFIFNSIVFSSNSIKKKTLVLIKDLPLTLVQYNPQILLEIRHLLSKRTECMLYSIPIVFIGSESKVERQFLKLLLPGEFDVFSESLSTNRNMFIKLVKLNPIPLTIIKSRLRHILKNKKAITESYEDILDEIVQASCGDLSHAISQLQFYFENGRNQLKNRSENMELESKVKQVSMKRTNRINDCEEVQSFLLGARFSGKEPIYNVFRIIGKILYNKREQSTHESNLQKFIDTPAKRSNKNGSFSNMQIYDINFTEKYKISDLRNFNFCEGFGDYNSGNFLMTNINPCKGKLSFDLEDLLYYSGVDDNTLILLLQENFIPFIGSSLDMIMCSDIFSWSDINAKYLMNCESCSAQILLSCIARTILFFNSEPLNPCSSTNHQQLNELKTGFRNRHFSPLENKGTSQKVAEKINQSTTQQKKSVFRWHPKKPRYKIFLSDMENFREAYRNCVNRSVPSINTLKIAVYLLFHNSLFTEILPYVHYLPILERKVNSLNNSHFIELVNFNNNWSKYNKYISNIQISTNELYVNFEDSSKLYNFGNSCIGGYCDYLTDEQLVSILETYEVETQKDSNLKTTSNESGDFDSCSDDPIDDNFN
ncbi:cell cycle checkpoint protein RAD17 isoform X1 [Cryptosporidium felis]|nr:cell cycle checkpoint protein RAD17 isoform X1 [Cryptosporidium felis]